MRRFAKYMASAPKSIVPSVTLYPPGSDPAAPGVGANIFLLAYNIGPGTAQTEASFQELADYAVPRWENTVACCT